MSIFIDLQYQLLKRIAPRSPSSANAVDQSSGTPKLKALLGESLTERLKNKVVVDFGCGAGLEAIEMARCGAQKVIGVDLRESVLEVARRHARDAGLDGRCEFTTKSTQPADLVVSLDSFEHFDQPDEILNIMHGLLKPNGEVLASFGPTWYHPLGGHTFSCFPWAHLLFSEAALIRWRADFKRDGATRFSEVEGGLNQMTMARFERLVERSPFDLVALEAVPIRALEKIHTRLTREFTTAVVRCRLRRPQEGAGVAG